MCKTAEDRVRRLMKQRTATDRLQMCSRMFATAKALVLAGIATQDESPSTSGHRRTLFLRFYGADFTERQREAILTALER